jgi:hypothetical protein
VEQLKQKILFRSVFHDDVGDESDGRPDCNPMDLSSHSLSEVGDGPLQQDHGEEKNRVRGTELCKLRLKRIDTRRTSEEEEDEDVDFGVSSTVIRSNPFFSVSEDEEDETPTGSNPYQEPNKDEGRSRTLLNKVLVTPLNKSDPGEMKMTEHHSTPTRTLAPTVNAFSTITKFFATKTTAASNYINTSSVVGRRSTDSTTLRRYSSPILSPPRGLPICPISNHSPSNTVLSPKVTSNRLLSDHPTHFTGKKVMSDHSSPKSINVRTGIESLQTDRTTKVQQHVGLRNMGNTCYLNSAIQMLFSVRPFLVAMSKFHKTVHSLSDQTISTPLLESVLDLAQRMGVLQPTSLLEKLNSAADPSQLKRTLDNLTDKFKGYEQRDSHEFAATFIDLLHEEVSAVDSDAFDPTDTFLLNVQVCLKCDSCGYTRYETLTRSVW